MTRPDDDPTAGVDVVVEHPERTVDEPRLRRALAALLAREGRAVADVTLVFTGHDDVRRLNVEYLGHDYDTDVLSFWLGDDAPDDPAAPLEGEVYVDLDTAAERCAEFGTTPGEEAVRYAVHGVLHLCGHDDATPEARAAMHAREDRYLTA